MGTWKVIWAFENRTCSTSTGFREVYVSGALGLLGH